MISTLADRSLHGTLFFFSFMRHASTLNCDCMREARHVLYRLKKCARYRVSVNSGLQARRLSARMVYPGVSG